MDSDEAISAHPTDTSFTACWQRFARERRLPELAEEPRATVTFTLDELRRQIAPQFFSAGLVHGEATRRCLEKLVTPPAAFQRRLPGVPPGFGQRRTA